MLRLLCLTILLVTRATNASKPLGNEVCVGSCYYSLLQARFEGPNLPAQKACTNALRVRSTYYCIALHCRDDESDVEAGIKWWAGTCKNSSRLVNVVAYRSAVGQAKLGSVASRPSSSPDLVGGTLLKEPVVPSSDDWGTVYRSVKTYSDLRDYHNTISWAPYGFWAVILLLGTASRVWSCTRPRTRPDKTARTAEQKSQGTLSYLAKRLKFDIQLAPTFSHRHHEPWGWLTVPLRLQSIVIASYIILHIAVCAVHYPILEENYYYKNKKLQILRCFGDRIAVLLPKSLPLIFLFGARSNPFQIATGWSYRTFSLFHRWIGVVMLLEAIIHGVVLSAYDGYNKGWDYYKDELRHDEVFRYGILAATSIGLSTALAARCFRAHFYEIFKAAHIILAAVALAALYGHVKTLFTGMYRVWVWVCVGIWAADYVVRFLRMSWINVLGRRPVDAVANYCPDSNIIKLHVSAPSSASRRTPGQYYFVSFGGWRYFWQSHPFSVAARSSSVTSTALLETDPKQESTATVGQTSESTLDVESLSDKPDITFMIRPRNGMTRRLRDLLINNSGTGSQKLKVMLEGPYGIAADVERYDDLLFIAGGTGITAVLPYMRMLLEDGPGREATPAVRLVWADPQEEFIRKVVAEDLDRLQGTCGVEKLSLDLYVTSSIESEQKPHKFQCKFSRPDIDALVRQFVQQKQQTVGRRAAVFVCGPGRMADDARAAVVRHAKATSGHVDLFEEIYEW
ncbi:hypothetical protein E4U43_008183 [Claviceps pusilla]|uniref:FAD-binding FR-type domain-containing protein n=1 Tax=Claviceps pusilla TaxID=123648 RepID=A0A9P7T0X9_9HYPO|nr:hypothetical protein E4U43_008183 [Claviceps pusilla]